MAPPTDSLSSSSILSNLESSNYQNIRQNFTNHLKPFSDFITFDFKSTNPPLHKSTKTKKKSNETLTIDPKLIHPIAKQFLSFINTALKLLPNRITELYNSSKGKDESTASDLLYSYKLCLECFDCISPCLVCKFYSVDIQRIRLVHCYEVWGKFLDGESEGFLILENLRVRCCLAEKNSEKISEKKKKSDGRCLLDLGDVGGESEVDKELAQLVAEIVTRIVKCFYKSRRKDDVVYKKVLVLVDEVGPWFRVLDSKVFERLYPDIVIYICKCTRFMSGEDVCFDSDSVHRFCMKTLTERWKSSAKDPFLKMTHDICMALSTQGDGRYVLVLDIFEFLLDFIRCDCKVGMKDTVNHFLVTVHSCMKEFRHTYSCRVVGLNLEKLASKIIKVSVPIGSVLRLYAAGLCFTKSNVQWSCIRSGCSLDDSLSTDSVHSVEDLQYITDALRALGSYFHSLPSNCGSDQRSLNCKCEHGKVSFRSYLNALAFFCHPYAESVNEASKIILAENSSAAFTSNTVHLLDAFQQFCNAFHIYLSCASAKDTEKFDEIQNTMCHVAMAALILSIRTDKNVKEITHHIERVISSRWVQLKATKFVIASLYNTGVELYNTVQLKQASDVFELCCKCTWTCINNIEPEDCGWSEEAISQFVLNACSKGAILLDVLHQSGRPDEDLRRSVKTALVNWFVVANFYESLDGPTELVRRWVKIMCKDCKNANAVDSAPTLYSLLCEFLKKEKPPTSLKKRTIGIMLEQAMCKDCTDADDVDSAPTLYSLLYKSLKKEKPPTSLTKRTIGIMLEQELLAYEEMEARNTNLCQTMQLKITEILLRDVYVRKDIQRSNILIKKGRLLRSRGEGKLKPSTDCLSEAVSILIDISGADSSNALVSHQLASAYCLQALCSQEDAEPKSKVIMKDIRSALKLWLSIDWSVEAHYKLVAENVVQLLCCVADLLSIKGHFDIQCDVYKLIFTFLKGKNVPPEKCLAMLWGDRRLTHALCTKPIDENVVSSFGQHFDVSLDTNALGFWLSCIEDSKPLLVGFRQKFSLYDPILAQVGHRHPGKVLGSNVVVDEVNEAASNFSDSDDITSSDFSAAYLYFDLSESLSSSGQLIEALHFAKEALKIRTKLLQKKFVFSFGKQFLNTNEVSRAKHDSYHDDIKVIGSVATEAWPSKLPWDFKQCILSQWNVLQCYLESLLQVGAIHETLGNACLAEALLLQGQRISSKEGLPIFGVTFASALGEIYCKKRLWDLAETELKTAKQILMDNSMTTSSKQSDCCLINCKHCTLTLEVTLDLRIGDLVRNRTDGAISSLIKRFSAGRDLYKAALFKLINIGRNPEPELNQRTTRSRSRSSKRNVKNGRQVEYESIRNSVENCSFGCLSTHSWVSVESNRPTSTEFGCSGNGKICWKCRLSKVMETGSMQKVIHLKWEFHCRRLSLRLLNEIGLCSGVCGEVHEMHEIFSQCTSMLFDWKEFSETYSAPHSLTLEFTGKERGGDFFANERAELLYNLSWFSLKNIHARDTCCDLTKVQSPSLVSWLLEASIISREVPVLFQKISRLLATIFVLSMSGEPSFSPLYPGKTLCGSHWAAFFHQASLGTYFNHQLGENPYLLKTSPSKDLKGSKTKASTETHTDVFSLLRFEPGKVYDLEKIVLEFFQSLPTTPIICITFLGSDYSNLLPNVLPNHPSSAAYMLLSRLHSDTEPISMLLPCDTILENMSDVENFSTVDETTESERKWFCPWDCTVVDDIAPHFKLILEGNYVSSAFCPTEDTQENRKLWWAWRNKLNERLDNFVRDIEESWLGPWKCLLLGEPLLLTHLDSAVSKFSTSLMSNFELTVNKNLLRVIFGGSRDVSVIEKCISQLLVRKEGCLSTACGQPQAFCEEFLHQMIVDACYDLEAEYSSREAIILVLDSDVQMLPWENLPVLRKHEVYRMPSVGSIFALIKGNIHRQEVTGRTTPTHIPNRNLDGTYPSIDPSDAFYLLNPSGDLDRTQLDFEDWFKNQNLVGKAGAPPSVQELVLALKDHDLFIYFGHGSGSQYIPGYEIEKLDGCAATLLMGCSSGSLRFTGSYNPQGVVLSYLLAGSPAIIANLWEVTDKDIDKFGKRVLSAWLQERLTSSIGTNLVEEFESMSVENKGTRKALKGKKTLKKENSISSSSQVCRPKIGAFMSEAREACTLQFLIGAAPVCYGVPTGIRKKEKTFVTYKR